MSRLNKWYNESRCKLEKEIWPELGAEGRSKKPDQIEPQQSVAVTSALDQHEYPKLGQKIKAGNPAKSKEIKQYYNSVNILQKSRSRKVKSCDPITLDLENIIKASASLSSKQKVLPAKRISKTESSSRSRRRVKPSRVKLPSSLKKAIIWERELRNKKIIKEIPAEVPEIDLEKLTLSQKVEDDISKNLGGLNIFGRDYRESLEVPIGDETVSSRPDLVEALEKLKVAPKSVNRRESLESSFGRMSTREETLNEDIFSRSLKLNDEEVRFSRKFREYCTNVLTPELSFTLDAFLTEIKRLQRKLYERDEVKGRSKKRLYAGFKEVEKYILVDKIKFVIIATDVDKIIENGILDKTMEKFTETCKKHQVAICFGLLRHKLGYFVHGKGIVSVVGIANYSGAENQFEAVLTELMKAKNEFNRRSMKSEKIVDLEKLFEPGSFLVSQRINSILKIASSIT